MRTCPQCQPGGEELDPSLATGCDVCGGTGSPDIDPDRLSEPWMQLHSGEPFYPLNPRSEDIHIGDIAHALSMVCRYAGHCLRFYSVAEHSVILSHTVDPDLALEALLHDATEAYVGDLVRPLKHNLPQYEAVEARLADAIAEKFGLQMPLHPQIKEHDYRIVTDEAAQVLAAPRRAWSRTAPALGVDIEGWTPDVAEAAFLHRYITLIDN